MKFDRKEPRQNGDCGPTVRHIKKKDEAQPLELIIDVNVRYAGVREAAQNEKSNPR